MSSVQPPVEKHERKPVPQKYLERIFLMAEKVWNGEKDAVIIMKDMGRGDRLFIEDFKR